nr:MFS transporter [uncultured Albidiferax sp.]
MRARIFGTWAHFPPSIRHLLWGQLCMNASHFMTVPLLAVFLSRDLGLGPAALATVMGANLLLAQSLPLLAGPLVDKYGAKPALVLGLCLRGLGLAGFASQSDTAPLVLSACLCGAGVAVYESALFGVLGREPPERLSAVFAANNQMLNLGVIVGPLLGALGSTISVRACFAVSAVLFGILSLRAWRQPAMARAHTPATGGWRSLRTALAHRPFQWLVCAAMPWYFLFPQLYVAFPIYLKNLSESTSTAPIYVVNGIVGVGFMVLARRWLIRTPPRQLLLVAYTAASLLFASVALTESLVWFYLFVVGYTVVETTILPALETLTSTVAPDGSQGTFFGVLSVAGALAGTAGYYVGSWLVVDGARSTAWLVFGAVGALGVVLALVLRTHLAGQLQSEAATA